MARSLPMRAQVAVLALLVGPFPRPATAQLPCVNTSLSAETRTELLLDAMTLEQKIQQIANLPLPNEELPAAARQILDVISKAPEIAIPTFRAANGGNGVRGGDCSPEPIATGLPFAIPPCRNSRWNFEPVERCDSQPLQTGGEFFLIHATLVIVRTTASVR